MSRLRIAFLTITVALAWASPARADFTGFVGLNTVPANRMAEGIALGLTLAGIGLEAEYSLTLEDGTAGAPKLQTAMLNLIVGLPLKVVRFHPYLTGGGGFYQETLGLHEDRDLGLDLGGGLKLDLIRPFQLRFDYRYFKLGSGALNTPAHRFYAGVTIPF